MMEVKNELEKIRKETILVEFEVLSQYLCWGTEEDPKTSVRIVCVPAEIEPDTSHIQVRRVTAWTNLIRCQRYLSIVYCILQPWTLIVNDQFPSSLKKYTEIRISYVFTFLISRLDFVQQTVLWIQKQKGREERWVGDWILRLFWNAVWTVEAIGNQLPFCITTHVPDQKWGTQLKDGGCDNIAAWSELLHTSQISNRWIWSTYYMMINGGNQRNSWE
jgi:hypothetical protein